MARRQLQWMPYDLYSRPKARETDSRKELKTEIRTSFNADISKRSNEADAFMRYSIDGYATQIVLGLGYVWKGWPEDIAYVDISSVGGTVELEKLLAAWKSGELRLEPATAEDRQKAMDDPESVHPNPSKLHIAREYERERRREAVVVSPLVFHLEDGMRELGAHPTSTRPAVAGLGLSSRERRRQRADTNKARARPVSNPYGRPLRHPKDGAKSSPFALSADHFTRPLVEDPGASTAAGPSASDWSVTDPLDEFEVSSTSGASSSASDIESATGFDALDDVQAGNGGRDES
ncbi:hypothetical protein FKP32DRAFT_1761148 [Trametes sanguinea]|nr:hypothetical protein FKP32DRAFT_1761148 [Trametes sanguinea]